MKTKMKSTVNRQRLTRAASLCLLALAATLLQAHEARAQWTTSGNTTTTPNSVGIGTASPSQIFQVHSTGTYSGTRVTTNATGSTISDGVNFGYDDAYGAYIWNREASPIIFSTTDTEKARLTAGGFFGLGTAAPASKFHVLDNDTTPDNEVFVETTVGNYGPTVRLKSSIPGQTADFLLTATAGSNAGGAGAFRIYDYIANTTRFFIAPNSGNVGIGTTSPAERLKVAGSIAATGSSTVPGSQLVISGNDAVGPWLAAHTDSAGNSTANYAAPRLNIQAGGLFFQFSPATVAGAARAWTTGMFINPTGSSVGIGTTSPIHKLDVSGNMTIGSGYTSSVQVPVDGLIVQGGVGIGTPNPDGQYKLDVAGDVRVSGNISAKYQDVAEWVPSKQKLQAGTVVILDKGNANHVTASTSAYDTRVAGVVSVQPGIALGEKGDDKALVATTGRVKVKVDATRAPIQIGDLIVTSDMAGVAMKSEPVSFGGISMHRPGTIIGKALESLDKGTGEILVLLSLQ